MSRRANGQMPTFGRPAKRLVPTTRAHDQQATMTSSASLEPFQVNGDPWTGDQLGQLLERLQQLPGGQQEPFTVTSSAKTAWWNNYPGGSAVEGES